MDKIKDAVREFGLATGGMFEVWALAGDSKRFARQRLMTALCGRKVPLSGCGVNALRRALLDAAGWNPTKGPMPNLCEASKDELIKRWCQSVCA